MNAARWFQRLEDYQPPTTPADSSFRKFDVKCLAYGSYQLRLVAQRNEEAGEMSVVLVCDRCSQRKILPVRWFLPWTWCFGYYPILNIQPIAYFTSMKNRIIVTCVAMSCVPLILILTGQATPVTFTIDNSQSVISVSGLMVNFAMTPQGTGALITSYSGSINADPSGSTIQFTGGSSINAHTNGVWQPAAGGAAGSAPADYGAQASGIYSFFGFITVYGGLRNISFDVTSPVLPVTGGAFNGTNLVFSFASINAALDYYSSILHGSLALTGYATNTVATGATETVNGSTQTLVIPIDATFFFKLVSANDTTVHLTGQLVATNLAALPAPVIRSVALTNQNVVVAGQTATGPSPLL